ncbi:MAG: GNAT family N-acetyltransferase [Candidatus Thorarchaeota archaeon]
MVFEVPPERYEKYRHFFDNKGFSRTFVESAFEYRTAKLLVDYETNPRIVVLLYPYVSFISGDVSSPKLAEMLNAIPEETQMNVDEETWPSKLRKHFGETLIQQKRTKMSNKYLSLDVLSRLKRPLPEGFSVERVDRETAEKLSPLLRVLIRPFFGSVDNFIKRGVGFCVKHGEEPISMASSAIPYTDILEVQIATVNSPEYRRKGFGTAACIALFEYCFENNIEPHWEAANQASVILAEKMGYTNPEPYYVYKWKKQKEEEM